MRDEKRQIIFNERVKDFTEALRKSSWCGPNYRESVDHVLMCVNDFSQKIIELHNSSRRKYAREHKFFKKISLYTFAIGSLIPSILLCLMPNDNSARFSQLGYIMLMVSGISVFANRISGGSYAHIRHATLVTNIEGAQLKLNADLLKIASTKENTSVDEFVVPSIDRINLYISELVLLLEWEAREWGQQVQEGFANLEQRAPQKTSSALKARGQRVRSQVGRSVKIAHRQL